MRPPALRVRLQRSTAKRAGAARAAFERPTAIRAASRPGPSIDVTGMRSPTPSTSQWVRSRTRSGGTTAPSNSSTKLCCSSILPPGGQTSRTVGAAVVNTERSGAFRASPVTDRKPPTRSMLQRMPDGSSRRKSNTHCRSPVQRPVPSPACGSSQRTRKGAAAWGSPKATAAWSKRATTCRTRAASPCGVRRTSCNACDSRLSSASPQATQDANIFMVSNDFSLRGED